MKKAKGRGVRTSPIPSKLYFRIGEVSDLVGVKPYVLRYWESEFQDIKPSKSKSGQRLYKRREVEMLLRIKELLYDERFTINGARKRLKDFARSGARDIESVSEVEVKSPRQLEVFRDIEEAGDVGRRVGHVSRDGTKTLLKIRKDLEELLKVVQG